MSPEDLFRRRLSLLLLLIAGAAALVVLRLVDLQVLRASAFEQRARSQHEGTIRLEGQRGTICDRDGRELAVSIEVDSAFVHPWQLRDARRTARLLAPALGMEPSALEGRISPHKPFVWVKRKISPVERERIVRLGLKDEVHFTRESKRFYPKGPLASHVLGFVGTDGVGLEGLEKEFDETIRGEGATFVVLRDAKGGAILQQVRQAARPGASLELTLDEAIQHAAEEELDAAMQRTQSAKGAVIVADPRTGEILALASRPGFDPNLFSSASPVSRKNVAIGERYEPGSTFKIITAATGLEEGRVRPTDWFDCGNGSIVVNTVRIRDHHSYSSLTFSDVIAKSSNVGIIRLGLRLGAPALHEYVTRFGFGQATGVGLSSEAEGMVHSLTRWTPLSLASVSMGQEILVTPIQMLQAFSAIANGGVLQQPRLLRAVVLPDGRRVEPQRREARRIVSTGTAGTLTAMMEQVVLSGTGKAAAIPGYRVAGKTGTAQKIGSDGRYSHSQHTSSFVGFAPAGNPRVAAIVMLDDPRGAYYGGEVAAPAFSRVVGAALERLRVGPEEEEIPPGPPYAPKPKMRERTMLASRRDSASASQARAEEPLQWPPRRPVSRRGMPAAEVTAVSFGPIPIGTMSPGSLASAGGGVSATDPAAGSSSAIPDLFGLSLRAAVSQLAEKGYRVVSRGNGYVVTQEPLAGAAGRAGEVCSLTLSLEPPDLSMLQTEPGTETPRAPPASPASRASGPSAFRGISHREPAAARSAMVARR